MRSFEKNRCPTLIQNEELQRVGNHSEWPAVSGCERQLGTATESIDIRVALELVRDLWRLLRGAGTPGGDVRGSSPCGFLEESQRQLRHTWKLARKDQRGTIEQLG